MSFIRYGCLKDVSQKNVIGSLESPIIRYNFQTSLTRLFYVMDVSKKSQKNVIGSLESPIIRYNLQTSLTRLLYVMDVSKMSQKNVI